ncbi:hypothetical protein [Planctomyces sp. SH-PL14]|uniref:hypothetical protein n=1 Tax=Planctomyces sp. SH-PL14 TaxID=1632864 RepID=UPI00078EC631|nr:hypothetical protein [Planctomyces sp. SH-PL14]AMV18892.1 hypothetical protein VT03_13465 [Planctomyces sp. SH-PL14]
MTRAPADLVGQYHSKDEIIRDVTFILTAPVADPTKGAVLKRAMWYWTEFDGKHGGCRYWTARARRVYLKRTTTTRGAWKKQLRHEHVVPRKVIREKLLSLEPPTEDAVRDIFERFVIAAVIHCKEDARLRKKLQSSMPPGFSDPASPGYQEPWLRYQACRIKPIDREEKPKLFEAFRIRRRRRPDL